jgi:uncharacterized membrane protein YkoI
MSKRAKATIGVVAAATLAAGGAAAALGGGGDDDATERAISGSALERASATALEHTGGGEVTGTEVGDEESYYEVEVTLPDGGQTDVQLDRSFEVVGAEADGGEEDAAGEG